MVHAVNHGFHLPLAGGRDQHAIRPVPEVQGRFFGAAEETGALKRDVHIVPGQLVWFPFCGAMPAPIIITFFFTKVVVDR